MGLFDRLFRQEKTDSQETLAYKELTEGDFRNGFYC